MNPEVKVQLDIIKMLKQRDIYHFKTIITNRRGVPDLIICYKGNFVAMEVKDYKGKASQLQLLNIEKIIASEGLAFIVRSVDEAEQILKGIR